MAWAELYRRALPGPRPESRRLLALLARTDPGFRPMIDDYSGGDTTCFFAPARGRNSERPLARTGPLRHAKLRRADQRE